MARWLGSLIAHYAGDALLEDRAQGRICRGVEEIEAYQDEWYNALAMESRSRFSCSGGAVVEEKGQSSGTATYAMEVLSVHDGKIAIDYVYFSDWLSDRIPRLAPALLKTAPTASDTRAASRRVARDYMSALSALSPAGLASLYGHQVVYQDTSRDIRYAGPDAVLAAHAKMFDLKGVRFTADGGMEGAGWAVVMWRRTDREGGSPPDGYPEEFATWAVRPTICGASLLEIRDGKIKRETIYCDHLRTRY
jgi:hypothetical protein